VEYRYFRMLRPTAYHRASAGELGYGLKFWPGSLDALTECMPHFSSSAPPNFAPLLFCPTESVEFGYAYVTNFLVQPLCV
jgi:hypothetical protein